MPEIVPCHRAGKFPEHLTPRMGALGFYAPYLKEHGCAGLSHTAYGLIMQELERADSGFAVAGVGAGRARDTGDSFLRLTGPTSALAARTAYRGSALVALRSLNTDTAQIRVGWKPAPHATATITF